MSKKLALALTLVAFAAACAPRQDSVVVGAEPMVSQEPVYTGKYGN